MLSDGPVTLPDIQKTKDTRGVPIRQVGVSNIRIPIRVRKKPGDRDRPALDYLDTVATFEMSVFLPNDVKGTHMSRFTEILNEYNFGSADEARFDSHYLVKMAEALTERLDSKRAHVRMELDYFVMQKAPVSGRMGVAPFKAWVDVVVHRTEGPFPIFNYITTGVEVLGKTCCPCSREISDFDHTTGKGRGAHAQRSKISISVGHRRERESLVWFEDLFEICQGAYSSPVYPVLKRPDERAVTVGAYDNPKFVEDVIRDTVVGIRKLADRVVSYRVRVENAESIHYHDAFAETSGELDIVNPSEL